MYAIRSYYAENRYEAPGVVIRATADGSDAPAGAVVTHTYHPVAKARLISDVIRSVAVIPDTITRSVYIKECSRLLGVNEEVLYTEVRKQKFQKNEDFKKKELREQARIEPVQPQAVSQPQTPPTPKLRIEEMEFLRFLLKHCKAELWEEEDEETRETHTVTVGEFMIDA